MIQTSRALCDTTFKRVEYYGFELARNYTSPTHLPRTTMSTPQDYRLPKDVIPTHYDLKVWTDLVDLKFEGVVEVQ